MNKNYNLYESFIVCDNDDDDDYEFFDDGNYSTVSDEIYRQVNDINLNLTRTLNDHDTISLYAYEDDEADKARKITWEEWYLKKKIENLKKTKEMKADMQKKWEEDQRSRNKKNYTEEEKNNFLKEWLEKKKQQQKDYELRLEKLTAKKKEKDYTKKVDKEKADENFQKWTTELKTKKQAEKKAQKDEEERIKSKHETIKLKRDEKSKKFAEDNDKKRLIKVRANVAKEATAIINGKRHNYYDWSTSPAPSFINDKPWQS